jgi:hypothetical protein
MLVAAMLGQFALIGRNQKKKSTVAGSFCLFTARDEDPKYLWNPYE